MYEIMSISHIGQIPIGPFIMPSITNCHLFKIKRKLGQENVFEFDVREDYGVLKSSPTIWHPQFGSGQEDKNPRSWCTPLAPEGEYGPSCQILFINISSSTLPGPDCRTWGQHNAWCLGSEHEEDQLVGSGGEIQQGLGQWGRWVRVPSPQGGSSVYLPKSSTLSLKTSLSMTEHEAVPPQFQEKWGIPIFSNAIASAKLGPRDVGVLESHNTDAHDTCHFCPSTQRHFIHPLSSGQSHPIHIPGPGLYFLLVLPLCLSLSLTTSLSISSFHSLGLAQFPYHKFNVSLPACLFLHLSPGFRISALCMHHV